MSLYDDEYFIHPNFIKPIFEQEVIDKNITNAYLIIFNFYGLENILISRGRRTFNRIKKSILNTIHNYFVNENCIFIKTSNNNYGIILKSKENFSNLKNMYLDNKIPFRKNDDELKFIENIINLFPKHVIFDKTSAPINIVGFASIYGIHSCLLNELIHNCEQTLIDYNRESTGSKIQLCDYNNSLIQSINEKNDFQQLNKLIDTKNIKVSLAPRKFWDINVLMPNFFSLKYLTADLQKILNNISSDMKSILLRHLAIRTIILYNQFENNNKYKLCIYYPMTELLNETFSAKRISLKIKSYNIAFSKIILIFDLDCFLLQVTNVIQNVHEIKATKFQILFANAKIEHAEFIKNCLPNYISFSDEINNNLELKKYFTNYCKMLQIKIVE